MSKYEHCVGKVEKELDNYTIYVYTPEMIVVEKLHAICQQMPAYQANPNKRARARDFYDIHLVMTAERMDLTAGENLTLLNDIFQAKEVPVALLKGINAFYEQHRLEWPAVRDSVSAHLEDFDFYFDFVSGDPNQTESVARHTVELSVKVFGEGHPVTATAMLEEAPALRRHGRKGPGCDLEKSVQASLRNIPPEIWPVTPFDCAIWSAQRVGSC